MSSPGTLVILNGKRPEHIRRFEESSYAKDVQVALLLTDGPCGELSKSLKRPVFYASAKLIEAFKIRAAPSVVRQSGAYMEATEVRLAPKSILHLLKTFFLTPLLKVSYILHDIRNM